MLQIIVILAVAFIVTPLIDLSDSPRTRLIAKAVVYVITLLWLIYTLFLAHGRGF
jgi:hypothetical protein